MLRRDEAVETVFKEDEAAILPEEKLSDEERVTSGVNFTQNHRFEIPNDVVSASRPRSDQGCRCARANQGQPLRVAAKTRPALTGPPRSGCAIWRSRRKNARGAGRTKECFLNEQRKWEFQTGGFRLFSDRC